MWLSAIVLDAMIAGLLISGTSSTLTSINFLITIIILRTYGLTMSYTATYVYGISITAFLLLVVLLILF